MLGDFNADYSFGMKNEILILEILKQIYPSVKNTKDLYNNKYCPYDLECVDTLFEVKSRRCKRLTYQTTFFEYSKTIKYDLLSKRLYIFFVFSDGIFFILYDKELFSTFGTQVFQQERTGINDMPCIKCLIPVNLLRPLNEFIRKNDIKIEKDEYP